MDIAILRDKIAFNRRFLLGLDFIDARLKHTGTGSHWHPNLRLTILRACRDDIEIFGLTRAMQIWGLFIAETIE